MADLKAMNVREGAAHREGSPTDDPVARMKAAVVDALRVLHQEQDRKAGKVEMEKAVRIVSSQPVARALRLASERAAEGRARVPPPDQPPWAPASLCPA